MPTKMHSKVRTAAEAADGSSMAKIMKKVLDLEMRLFEFFTRILLGFPVAIKTVRYPSGVFCQKESTAAMFRQDASEGPLFFLLSC